MSQVQAIDLNALNARFSQAEPEEIIRWCVDTFGDDAGISSSFGAESACLLHLVTQIKPEIRVVFVDTGFLLPETLAFKEALKKRLHLNVLEFAPKIPHAEFLKQYGNLYERDPDLCCEINKVEPMRRAIAGLKAWMSGVRADQTDYRKGLQTVDLKSNGLYKVAPILRWSPKQVFNYLKKYDLPMHPLWEKGYSSIGCEPCTAIPGNPEDPRSGRWKGQHKSECGIHTFLDKK
jgi:phosphoadenosine phosphosulfate reductase